MDFMLLKELVLRRGYDSNVFCNKILKKIGLNINEATSFTIYHRCSRVLTCIL